MPDLGAYTSSVLWSYAVALLLLAVLVALTFRQGRRARRALEEIERRKADNG